VSKCTYLVKDPTTATLVIDRKGSKTYETVNLPAKYCGRRGTFLFTQSMTGEHVTLCKTHATDAAFRTALEMGYTHEPLDPMVEI
jgi:hypothetical protein